MSETSLKAQPRTLLGRKIKRLRKEGFLPANVFGKGVDSLAIQISYKEFHTAHQKAGETGIINLTIEGEKTPRPVLVSDIHSDPVTGQELHLDLRQVDLKQKITTTVPLEVIGESIAVKDLGGILVTMLDEIEVEALPTDLPDKIEVDITSLEEVGSTITAGDLKLSSNLELKTDPETALVSVQAAKEEEEPEPEETEETSEGESSEGESAEKADKPDDSKPEEKQSGGDAQKSDKE